MESTIQTVNQDKINELIKRRDHERKLVNEKNQRKKEDKSELEGIDYFDNIFDSKLEKIENYLNSLESTTEINLLTQGFEEIGKELQELQKYLSSSTIFLKEFKIKVCQSRLNQLLNKTDDTKSRLIPKKKFGFKNKSKDNSSKKRSENVETIEKQAIKLQKTFEWTESKQSKKWIILTADRVNNQDLTLSELENCIVEIYGHPGSLQISDIKNCLIVCGPVSRSVFADKCVNCVFAFCCQQLRLHSSKLCKIYLHVVSRGIIEDSTYLKIAPFNYTYDGFDKDLKNSKLEDGENNWQNIGDFNWLSIDEPSPNWSVMSDQDKIIDWVEYIKCFEKEYLQ